MITAETTEPISVSAFSKMSHEDIQSAIKGEPPEGKEEIPEPKVESEAVVETQPEEIEVEEELPKGVQKRIAKEAERAAAYQSKIDAAVAATKAKEAELAKMTSGAEPDKNTEKAKGKPVRPDINTFPGTIEEYHAAMAKFDDDYADHLRDETRKTVEAELTAKQQNEARKQAWGAATEKHGAEFPNLMKSLAAGTSEDLQIIISGLDPTLGLAVHLAKNPEDLKSIVEMHGKDRNRAIAALGKLEDKIAAVPTAKPLPAPLKKVGGDAPAGSAPDLNKLSGSAFNRELRRRGF